MGEGIESGITTLEYHVLLALAGEALYGYAITTAIVEESGGTLTPRAGTLYRVLARLMAWGLVVEADSPEDTESHPGRARRWYSLTALGRQRLAAESRRLIDVASLAQERLRPRRS
jgi:DNA-binding PadR family transcriptional regulator